MELLRINAELERLEKNEEWRKAKDLLYHVWENDKTNLESLLRVGTECWYVLTFWERIQSDNMTREEFAAPLTEVKQYGEMAFRKSDSFLWVFGYMISLFPYWFDDFDDDIYKWEAKGRSMIKEAYQVNPENHIAKMLGMSEESDEYQAVCRDARAMLCDCFPGDSAIEGYFKGVLSRGLL
ncbi:MAG: hypothetical protein LBM28_05105 [Oscillospiraceae bacterium]|jgi:hypothetical protein|nr:hypothetical protein [Oscillospiraceae bacterium]